MKKFRVAVHVIPRRGILDPQGKAVGEALRTLGFAGVGDVHVGRHIVLDVEASGTDAARESASEMCRKLLANPVTEDFEIASVNTL